MPTLNPITSASGKTEQIIDNTNNFLKFGFSDIAALPEIPTKVCVNMVGNFLSILIYQPVAIMVAAASVAESLRKGMLGAFIIRFNLRSISISIMRPHMIQYQRQ